MQVGHRFFQRANALHPNDDPGHYDAILAKQELYYECYMSAFSREEFNKMLTKAISGDIKLPEENDRVDAEKYRKAYKREAEAVYDEFFKTEN
jgi:hypothetical protein